MNSRLQQFTRTFWVVSLLTLLAACQDTIPKRSLISPGSTATLECPPGQEAKVIVDDEGVETEVCKDIIPKRPDNAVFWNQDFCICKDNKAISLGNCATFCSSKATNGAEVLYASFRLTEDITMTSLENLSNWCLKPFETDETNPSCVIQAKDASGNVTTINDVTISTTSNSLTTNVQNLLAFDKTYTLTLIEKTSGAKSDTVQLVKYSSDSSLPTLGPLKPVPVSQYTCMVRSLSSTGNYDQAYRLHYYFVPRLAPDPLPAGTDIFCHDIFNTAYGNVDREGIPRLETVPGVFKLWDEQDPRFYDNDGNGRMDINEAIVQKTRNFGATIPADSKFFQIFSWQNGPELETDDSSESKSTLTRLGYLMAPWVDTSNYKSYCLTDTHYNSSNALFKAMRDYVGVETEGLYIGMKSAETVTDNEGNPAQGYPDYILIRETDLKAVWFYYKSGVPTAPTDDNVASNTIYFHYPLNKTSPFVKSSTQRLFRVKSAAEINGTSVPSGSTSTGVPANYPPHDRKLGCIPKL